LKNCFNIFISQQNKLVMTLFIPSKKILVPAGDSNQGQKVALASKEWFDLQTRVQSVLNLPFDIGSYDLRYGDSSSGDDMKDIFKAMRDLRNVAERYGNPKGLRSKLISDPNILAIQDRPENDAYSAMMWTMTQARSNSFKLASTLKAIPTMASRRSPKDAVAGIKSMFLDTNQMVDKLRITVENFEVLAKQLEGLEAELSKSQDAMRTYTEKSSNTRKALDSEIGGMRTKIAKLEKDRDLAYELWLDLTIAAVAVTAAIAIVGVAISVVLGAATVGSGAVIGAGVTAGLTAGAGAALGVAAGVARSSYDGLISDLRDENTLLKKRVAFQHDLGALDSTMQFTLPSSSGLITQVKGMKFGWESLIEEIKEKVGNLTVDNLSDGPWLQQDKMNAASANWTTVDDAIKAFNSNSLIDYDLIEFGSSLPADDPNWEGNLERILAA
jgi:hypothetical protein